MEIAMRPPATAAAPAHARCGACASRFNAPAWRALPVVATLDPQSIAPLVLRWPAGASIEIRRCSRCGGSIARRKRDPLDVETEPETAPVEPATSRQR